MPSSDAKNIPFVVGELQRLQPTSILDVGVGFGKWGALSREYLECWAGRYNPADWKVRIEGIEIYGSYRNPIWDTMYNKVHIGDARKLIGSLGRFDIGLCCDVIEHMEKQEGHFFLRELTEYCDFVILTTPSSFWVQQPTNDNKYEEHLSLWGAEDFAGYSGRLVELGATFGAVLSKGKPNQPKIRMQKRLDHIGVRLLLRAFARRLYLKITSQVPSP